MAIGDIATLAGLEVFPATQDRRLGYENDNIRGDEIGDLKLKVEAAAVGFTPVWSNLTVGNGVQSWKYSKIAGRVFVSGSLTFGTTTVITAGNPCFGAPIPGRFAPSEALGVAQFAQSSGTRRWGAVLYDLGLLKPLPRFYSVVSAMVQDSPVNATAPHSWAPGDILTLNYNYPQFI